MSATHWGNWQQALGELQGQTGEWWVVTPFLTRGDAIPEPANTRVLTTLPLHKLATNDVNDQMNERTLDALAALLNADARIRVLDDLHAKVYLRRTGTSAVGYQGSANLTGKALRNEEVMSGLVAFDAAFLQHLDALWDQARPLYKAHLLRLREQARLHREQLAAFAGLIPEIGIFVIEREYGLGSFSLNNRRLHLPPNEVDNGYSPARVDFIHKDRTRGMTAIVSDGLDRLLGHRRRLPAGPPLAYWLSNTSNMFAVRRDDADTVRLALMDIQEQLQDAARKLGRTEPELEEDFIGRLRTWLADRQIRDDLSSDIEREARAEYRKVIVDGTVQLRYTELVAHWPEETHPWRPIFTQMIDQTQERLFDTIRLANRPPTLDRSPVDGR